jgi:patatin-like phospholipase/acyl hydrolase
LACAMCAPSPMPAVRVAEIYEEEGPAIFDRSVWQRIRSAEGLLDEKYDAAPLDRALERFLAGKRLADTRPELIVPAYDMTAPGPYFFKTRNARERPDEDFPLTVVARATAAAPTYFEAHPAGERALVDGGVFAVNPAMSAFAEVLRFHPSADVVLLSLGTGERTRRREFADVKDWGLVEWARPILDVVFDGISDAVDYQLRHVLGDGRYWRLQVELTEASDDLDDASPENLRALRGQAEELMSSHSAQLDAALRALDGAKDAD